MKCLSSDNPDAAAETLKTHMKPKLLMAVLAAVGTAHAQWQPVENSMLTRWGKEINPSAVWTEYPRPMLERPEWTNLNGLWAYGIAGKDSEKPEAWAGEILVPFAPEAPLSGVGRLIDPTESLWYKRSLPTGPAAGKRTLLHFEAVDHETTVWVNGSEVGRHRGGNTPFSFDITDALKPDGNELLIKVLDATEGFQLHGKQKLKPEGIWYTRVSGIWQTVWLEQVPERSIQALVYAADTKAGTITVTARLSGTPLEGESLRVTTSIDGAEVATANGPGELTLTIGNPRLWSPASPSLYDIQADLLDGGGVVVDSVKSYTALRELGKARDANGHLRFTLNGEPVFHWGPLDQGWWPDGLLTPPSEAAMISDIQYLRDAGFNMIRKHIKVEPRRYYHACDRLGMMVWQDQVSTSYGSDTEPRGSSPPWTRLAPNPPDGVWPDEAHEQFMLEYSRMIEALSNHPSIVCWVPFNEAWGQHRTMEVGRAAVALDPTRPVNIASGGNFFPVGDIADEHAYPNPAFPVGDPRFQDYIKVVGEFGGHGWPVKGHLWRETKENWGYGGLPKTLDEWKERYTRSIDILAGLRRQGIAAGVYTQTTDVEGEINGLLTYDRTEKVPAAWLKVHSERLLGTPDDGEMKTLLATADEEPQEWRFTKEKPADGWQAEGFDDSQWRTGRGGFGTRETPNTRVNTDWNSDEIWLRRDFEVAGGLPEGRLLLKIFHDEDASVFLNGKEIAKLGGYVGSYLLIDLDAEAAGALRKGRNTLAVQCRQTDGGQYIDAGLIEEVPR
jgi:beta-galactosidase/beta-glucuronidase